MAKPDLILHDGNIYPTGDGKTHVEALAVWNGQITDIGSDRDILRLKTRSVRSLDLKGRTVLPGFCDSHIHLLGYGLSLNGIRLHDAKSVEEVQNRIVRAARKDGGRSWLVGRGWDQEKLREHRYLEKKDLDIVQDRPVFLRRVCGHIGAANSVALSEAQITGQTTSPEGGEIVLDPKTREPTGLLKEKAMQLVEENIRYEDLTVEKALVSASRQLLRLGLTSLHCIIQNAQELRVLRKLCADGRVKQSIYAIIPASAMDEAIELGLFTEINEAGSFRIGGVKVFMDGSLGAKTAALTEPYSDDPTNIGILTFSEDQLRETVIKAEKAGFQLCIHAIGDRALGTIVKVMETFSSATTRKRLRHRVEHCSVAPPPLVARMKKLGLTGSVQPRFIYSDNWMRNRLGDRRLADAYPFRSMLRRGIVLASGSDGPVEDPNPMEGVWSAVARPGLPSTESLTVGQALVAYTMGGAFASNAEAYAGALIPGKRADMVVLDRDPFTVKTEELKKVKVAATIVRGDIVYGA